MGYCISHMVPKTKGLRPVGESAHLDSVPLDYWSVGALVAHRNSHSRINPTQPEIEISETAAEGGSRNQSPKADGPAH
jgi:hypothetical protein